MKKETQQLERRGLPGGPNEMFTYTTGVFSTEGFRMDSPDVNNYQNIIPSGSISMKERDGSPLRKGPIHGVDNLGYAQVMYPGFDYQFPGTEVTETLMAKMGGALLDKTIKCGNCGWEWKAADGGSDLYDCHKCGGKGLVKAQGGIETKLNPYSYDKSDSSLRLNPFLSKDPESNIFIGGISPSYSTKDFSIEASAVGVGNKDFMELPADYGIRGSYNPTDSLSINAGLSKNNIGAGVSYRFKNGGNIAQVGLETNVEDGIEKFNTVQNWFNEYTNSPLYKENLIKSGYRDPQAIINERLANINTTKFENNENRLGSYYRNNKINYSPIKDKKNSPNNEGDDTIAHEFGHSSIDAGDFFTGFKPGYNKYDYEQLIKRNKNPKISRGAHENYADLKAIQYEAEKAGIYKPGYEPFTKEHLDKLKNTGHKLRALENYSEEDLIWLENNIAQVDDQSQSPIAQVGTEVKFDPKKFAADKKRNTPLQRSVDKEQQSEDYRRLVSTKEYKDAVKAQKAAEYKATIAQRKADIKKSDNAVLNSWSAIPENGGILNPSNWTRENVADAAAGLGDKARLFPDEFDFFDEYLNPGVMIGNMAQSLGNAPLQAQQTNSYLPYITSIGAPLAVGALAGFGTQNTGQFVNNLVNPLAGTGDLAKGLYNKGITSLENVGIKTSIAPELRQGLRTAGPSFGSSVDNVIPTFKSEIDWENWVKTNNKNWDAEDIKNINFNKQEYDAIEQQAKADGTWMKYEKKVLDEEKTLNNKTLFDEQEKEFNLKNAQEEEVRKSLYEADKAKIKIEERNKLLDSKFQDYFDNASAQWKRNFENDPESKLEFLDIKGVNSKEIDNALESLSSNVKSGETDLLTKYESVPINKFDKPNESVYNTSIEDFPGTPEQFIQSNSQNFKEAYPEGWETVWRGGDRNPELNTKYIKNGEVIFTSKDEYGANVYNRSDNPEVKLSNTETPPEGLTKLYAPKTENKIVIDGDDSYMYDGRRISGDRYRTNYARLDAINQTPSTLLQQENLNTFQKWMRNKYPEVDLTDRTMTDHFASFLNSPEGRNINRVEFKKIFDGTIDPIDVEVHNLNNQKQLKSMFGNNGMFDMTNPNIYKSILPFVGYTGAGALTYKALQGQQETPEYKQGGLIEYQTKGEVKFGTPEYEQAYNRGEVITEDGQRSPILLNEVVVQNDYKKPRGFWEQSRDQFLEENKDAGVLGAIGSVVTYPFGLPQQAMMYGLTDKVQKPSEVIGFENTGNWFDNPESFAKNASNFIIDNITDPANLIGAGELTALGRLSKAKALAKLKNTPSKLTQGLQANDLRFNNKDRIVHTLDDVEFTPQDEILELHNNLLNRFNTEEGKRRLGLLGIDNTKLNPSELSFKNTGSGYTPSDNTMDIDLQEAIELGIDPSTIYAHETGHWLAKQYGDQSTTLMPQKFYETPIDQEFIASYPENLADELLAKNPTADFGKISKETSSAYLLKNKDEGLPFLREMRQNMLNKGYINDEYDDISQETIDRFIKENPDDRISSFTEPNSKQSETIYELFKNLPAVIPGAIGLGTLGALQQQAEGGEPSTQTTPAPSPLVEYVVKKGDTLSKIAAANNTSIRSIMKNNESISDPNMISIDQKINIVNKTVDAPGEQVYKDWNTIRDKKDKINKLSDEQKIVTFHNDKPEETYLIVDKKNAVMKLYTGGNLTKSFEVGVGQNPGDAQTVTKIENGKTNWSGGNKSTGAGIYTISNINPASAEYYNEPAFNLKNENGIEVSTTIHGTPKPRRIKFNNGTVVDNRMSNGCINGKCEDLKELYGQLDINTKVYILPEDVGNNFQIIDGKPALKVSSQNRQRYNSYIDQTGTKQKGQGANQTTNTLVYKPVKAYIDETKFKDDVFQWNDFNDEKEYASATKPFIAALTTGKKNVMKAAKISSDVYNELAKMSFGIYGTESNFGDTHSAVGNLARATNKFLDPKSSSSPDYKAKASTYGADENSRSVGLTQLRWNYLNVDEKKALKEVGITSNKDFLDPKKAAIGTVTVLGVRYNQQLNDKQKQDVWKYLPTKWNNRANYSDRVKSNSSYLSFKQLDKKEYGGESKPGSLMQAYNKLTMEKKMGGVIANKKQFGGQLNSGNITMYRDYIKGTIGNETEAIKNYDKLNRIYYTKAKESGMTVANYIMTYIANNS